MWKISTLFYCCCLEFLTWKRMCTKHTEAADKSSSSFVTHSHFVLGLYHILYCSFLTFRNRITYCPGLLEWGVYSADYTEQVLQDGSEQCEMANSHRGTRPPWNCGGEDIWFSGVALKQVLLWHPKCKQQMTVAGGGHLEQSCRVARWFCFVFNSEEASITPWPSWIFGMLQSIFLSKALARVFLLIYNHESWPIKYSLT